MAGSIFVIDGQDELTALNEEPYESEKLLQELLAKYPDLLAGDQMDRRSPRRWLLISREVGIPGEEGGAERWSVDHLFLDQDGVPTLVEVKRSSDTRIRREVVGQMLDYAANAAVYWSVETLIERFKASSGSDAATADAKLSKFLEGSGDWEQFWQKVKTNLQAGRIRLVFVADQIPSELRRIVEFLSKQMTPAEVLAVEIRQFAGSGIKTLVPTVTGQKESPRPPTTPYQEFFQQVIDELREKHKFTNARTAPRQNYCEFSSGIKRIGYNVSFSRGNRLVIDLWLDRREPDETKALFDSLHRESEAIEMEFGSKLSWETPREGNPSRHVAVERDGSIRDDWPELQSWIISNLLNFKRVVIPRLKNLLPLD